MDDVKTYQDAAPASVDVFAPTADKYSISLYGEQVEITVQSSPLEAFQYMAILFDESSYYNSRIATYCSIARRPRASRR